MQSHEREHCFLSFANCSCFLQCLQVQAGRYKQIRIKTGCFAHRTEFAIVCPLLWEGSLSLHGKAVSACRLSRAPQQWKASAVVFLLKAPVLCPHAASCHLESAPHTCVFMSYWWARLLMSHHLLSCHLVHLRSPPSQPYEVIPSAPDS